VLSDIFLSVFVFILLLVGWPCGGEGTITRTLPYTPSGWTRVLPWRLCTRWKR